MKSTILAAALLAAAPFALAQAEAPKAPEPAKVPDVPKPGCDKAPELPGNTMMQDSAVRKRFEDDVRKYTACIKAYATEREATIKANRDAANQAINEYNAWQTGIMEEQKKRRGETGTGNTGESSGAGDRVKSY
jgi:hypothetical protein